MNFRFEDRAILNVPCREYAVRQGNARRLSNLLSANVDRSSSQSDFIQIPFEGGRTHYIDCSGVGPRAIRLLARD